MLPARELSRSVRELESIGSILSNVGDAFSREGKTRASNESILQDDSTGREWLRKERLSNIKFETTLAKEAPEKWMDKFELHKLKLSAPPQFKTPEAQQKFEETRKEYIYQLESNVIKGSQEAILKRARSSFEADYAEAMNSKDYAAARGVIQSDNGIYQTPEDKAKALAKIDKIEFEGNAEELAFLKPKEYLLNELKGAYKNLPRVTQNMLSALAVKGVRSGLISEFDVLPTSNEPPDDPDYGLLPSLADNDEPEEATPISDFVNSAAKLKGSKKSSEIINPREQSKVIGVFWQQCVELFDVNRFDGVNSAAYQSYRAEQQIRWEQRGVEKTIVSKGLKAMDDKFAAQKEVDFTEIKDVFEKNNYYNSYGLKSYLRVKKDTKEIDGKKTIIYDLIKTNDPHAERNYMENKVDIESQFNEWKRINESADPIVKLRVYRDIVQNVTGNKIPLFEALSVSGAGLEDIEKWNEKEQVSREINTRIQIKQDNAEDNNKNKQRQSIEDARKHTLYLAKYNFSVSTQNDEDVLLIGRDLVDGYKHVFQSTARAEIRLGDGLRYIPKGGIKVVEGSGIALGRTAAANMGASIYRPVKGDLVIKPMQKSTQKSTQK